MKNIFIGGAWPYANNSLHVGHLAALLPGDVIARYNRQIGNRVIYVSGTDSHGTPITVRALNEKTTPEKIAKSYDSEFRDLFNKYDFSYDLYTNTMNEYHIDRVQTFFKDIYDNGFLYPKEESQDFCNVDKKFLADREIEGTCPYCGGHARGDQCEDCMRTLETNQLLNKHCKICSGTDISSKINTHLVFALTAFQGKLESWVEAHTNDWRTNAYNETRKYLTNRLQDRTATRVIDWGVSVTIENFQDKKIYVWIEAVLGYITAGEQVAKNKGWNYNDFFKHNEEIENEIFLVHGKDNIPFHTVIYPALLLAMNENYKLPDKIISSEYVNVDGQKMSKSKGNYTSAMELLEKFDSETIRFYFLLNGPEKRDMNFLENNMVQLHNKILVGGLGNFVNRNLAFLIKKHRKVIHVHKLDSDVIDKVRQCYESITTNLNSGNTREAIAIVVDLISYCNKYYDENEPWVLFKKSPDDFDAVTFNCVFLMINVANLIKPFLPRTSKKISDILGVELPNNWGVVKINKNITVERAPLLFETIQTQL